MENKEELKLLIESSRIDDAIEYCLSSIARLEKGERWNDAADMMNSLGWIYDYYRSDYQRSLAMYKAELNLRQQRNLPNAEGALIGIAMVNNFIRNDMEALKYCQFIIDGSGDKSIRAKALNIKSDIMAKTNIRQAEDCILESEELLRQLGDKYMLCHARMSKALLLAKKGELSDAVAFGIEQLDYARTIGHPGILGTGYLRMAEIYRLSGNRERAIEYAKMALKIGTENNWEVLVREAKNLMSNVSSMTARKGTLYE